jgi:hypothetical protein
MSSTQTTLQQSIRTAQIINRAHASLLRHTLLTTLFTTHCTLRPPLTQATLASTKQLPSSRTPLQSSYSWVPACSVSLPFVPEVLGIVCPCLLQPLASGSREKAALRAVALPGVAAPCYNTVCCMYRNNLLMMNKYLFETRRG